MRLLFLFITCTTMVCAESSKDDVILYFSDASSSSLRVKLALDYKGIKYHLVDVNLLDEEDHYRKINPMKKVPALFIDGRTLSQSVAILEYIEETRPEKPLLPSLPYERALVRQLVQIVACDIQPLQNGAVLLQVSDGPAWAKYWIHRGVIGVEAFLSEHAGKYSVGNSVTMADFFLYPQILNVRNYGVDLKQYKELDRVAKNLIPIMLQN